MVRFTVDEGTNISIMDLHGFLYRIPGLGGQAVRIPNVYLGIFAAPLASEGLDAAAHTKVADS
jgi:hypothetical protein